MIICINLWQTFLWGVTLIFLFVLSALVYWTFEEWFGSLKQKRLQKKLNKKQKRSK